MSVRRAFTVAVFVAALAVSSGGLSLDSQAASASTFSPTKTFVAPSEPIGVAVDSSTGHVFVAGAAGKVQEFDAEGQPIGELKITGGLAEPHGVAVDNSTNVATNGDVYVADTKHNAVERFKPIDAQRTEYEYECKLTGTGGGCSAGGGTPTKAFELPGGVAVGPGGDVYVADFSGSNSAIFEFEPGGNDLGPGELKSPLLKHESVSLAVDAEGNVYAAELFKEVIKLTINSSHEVASAAVFDSNKSTAVAVEPAVGGNVFAVDGGGTYVSELEPSEGLVEKIGQGELALSGGIAFSPAKGKVYLYVSDLVGEDVHIYAKVILPEAITEAPSEVSGTGALLNGSLNANGEAHWYFEYGESKVYGSHTPLDVATGSAFAPAHAAIAELKPNTSYHYQLRAYNAEDESIPVKGGDIAFKTAAIAPVAVAVAVSTVTPQAATLNATVDPENSATTYRFEYGPCATVVSCPQSAYPLRVPTPDGTVGSGLGSTPVSQRIEELQPETAYHYRVAAVNSAGETQGAEEETFTTAPGVLPGVATGVASGISQSAATISGTIDPKGVPSTYEWQIGTSTSYGTTVIGSAGQGNGPQSVSLTIGDLAPDTTYHYRLVARDRYGTVYGADESFPTATQGGAASFALPPSPLFVPTQTFPEVKNTNVTKPKVPTRAQKLASALKACRKKAKDKRSQCEKRARKNYGSAKAKRKH